MIEIFRITSRDPMFKSFQQDYLNGVFQHDPDIEVKSWFDAGIGEQVITFSLRIFPRDW
ncbi:hypothetical protein [Deinococcus cellulosilyticus]|uniref:Uncharacterized protein n=1 Tax=Deinococcus cellulosilyticus (strain DSM 18568 / NBRC 106333 / KACC 11606 / 5516J-15) TaxID=1223518 RepID=A0A511N752_DEIC1|nr:hypothetical protein [Deinococcus cellulosilyticus]GEM48682.1 hypothetical protein DC3_43170 [Deinococcus cellulosilyticus NBRC 106333 = KACC 11606]